MSETNKIIQWAVKALLDLNNAIPEDGMVKQAFKLAGVPVDKIEIGAAPLESIFSVVSLTGGEKTELPNRFTPWHQLSPEKLVFPADRNSVTNGDFRKQIRDLESDETLEKFQENDAIALAFLEKYGTYLAISNQIPHLPFYDVVKMAATIYVCLKETDGEEKFLLLGGDLSGIQSYIFDLSESNSKGVAKILRARSFYLGLITQISIHYILHTLELSLFCNVIDAGGRFMLMVPNTTEIISKLEQVKKDIASFFLREFHGELVMNLTYNTELSGKELQGNSFKQKLDTVNRSLEMQKYRPFENDLIDDNKWNSGKFIFEQDYEKYEHGLCRASGKHPKIKESKPGEDEYKSYSEEFLLNVKIGGYLVKNSVVAYSYNEVDGCDKVIPIPISSTKNYRVCFFKDDNALPEDLSPFYLIEDISHKRKTHLVPRYLANYVPHYTAQHFQNGEFIPVPKLPGFRMPEQDKEDFEEPKKGDVMDFTALAYQGILEKKRSGAEENGEVYRGKKMLGIIKADVDKMGQIFSEGFGKDGERLSLASYATLSRHLNMFFTVYLPFLQSDQFKNIYTVYAGGDDLFLVGEWQESVELAKKMYAEFRNYTCNNDDIKLSTGIHFIAPRNPIRLGAEHAEERLKEAKNSGRDRITFFETTIRQKNLNELIELGCFFDKKMQGKNPKINTSFLHRLLNYHGMAMRFFQEGKIDELIYLSRLSYDVGRNIIKRNKSTNRVEEGEEEYRELIKLMEVSNKGKELMLSLKIPLFWAIYRNRKV